MWNGPAFIYILLSFILGEKTKTEQLLKYNAYHLSRKIKSPKAVVNSCYEHNVWRKSLYHCWFLLSYFYPPFSPSIQWCYEKGSQPITFCRDSYISSAVLFFSFFFDFLFSSSETTSIYSRRPKKKNRQMKINLRAVIKCFS